MTEVRILKMQDISAFFHHRLEGLNQMPTAFGASFEDESAAGPSRWESLIQKQDPANVIFGAFLQGQIVGCIGIFQEDGEKSKHKSMIWGMYVKKASQGQGIGRQLILKAIDHAKSIQGVNLINLTVESGNVSAKALYESCGFETWGREPRAMMVDSKYYDEDHMMLSMIK